MRQSDQNRGVSTVGFVVRVRADLNDIAEVVPTVDGVELTTLAHAFENDAGMETRDVSYGGLIPANYRFGLMSRHFLGGESGKVPLLGCDCGEWGCWPLLAVVTVTDDEVVWSDFEQPHRATRNYENFGPFRFGRSQYEDAAGGLDHALDP